MINLENLLNILSQQAQDKEFVFKRLYRNLYNKELHMKALADLSGRKGIGAIGADGEDLLDGFSQEKLARLIESLRDQSYRPKPLRRAKTKKDGKEHAIGVMSFTDRLVQEAVRIILTVIYEPVFSGKSHGYRKGRSCHTCLDEVKKTFTGVSWFVKGDIESCAANINHETLMKILAKRISDDRFLNLIRKFLNAGYLENLRDNKTYSGVPEGSGLAPVLMNIYLNELDDYILNTLKPEFDRGGAGKRKKNPEYVRYGNRMSRLSKKIDKEADPQKREEMIREYKELRDRRLHMQAHLPNQGEFRRIQYDRYADDFLIGVIGSKEDCREIEGKIRSFLRDELGLKLSDGKSGIFHSSDPVLFLGYEITARHNSAVTRNRNGIRQRRHNKRIVLKVPRGWLRNTVKEKHLVKDVSAKHWMPTHRPELFNCSDLEILTVYNSELKGWYNYYALAENVASVMGDLAYCAEYSCLKTLAAKHRTSLRKYRNAHATRQNRWGIAYDTPKGKRTMEFYRGFTRKKPSRNKEIDIRPNVYRYIGNRNRLENEFKAGRC